MAGLKEIKGHIASVRSTLKITSAMKMVSSAKLRKAQQAAENMRPYEAALHDILMRAGGRVSLGADADVQRSTSVALVVISSNSSLCGAFNANVIREARSRIAALRSEGRSVTVYSIGRKAAEAMRRDGMASPADYNHLVGRTDYEDVSDLARTLVQEWQEGLYASVELIYNHFVSTASQQVVREQYLPFEQGHPDGDAAEDDSMYILEPDRETILATLLPKVIRLKLYTVILDSVAAEHAARTVAMQTATDNGEELLRTLTLQYNKSRQQKITAEILDIVGGSMQ